MFTSYLRFIRQLCLSAVLLMVAGMSLAADLNPNDVAGRIDVKSLNLQGFSSIDGYPLDIRELRTQLSNERERYGSDMTVDELHQIADAMTVFVRRKGFVFHTVYLPPQKITDGDVRFELQEGILADVHVLNKTRMPSARIERAFTSLLGQLLYAPDVEARVQALKAQAGIRVFAFYSRGNRPGQARLNLRVEPTRAYSYGLKLDNFGSKTSGENRAIAQWSVKSLTGRFDTLSLAVLTSVDETANTYGSLSYRLPTASLSYVWDVSASNNQFELGDRFADLGLEGNATILGLGLTYHRVFEPTRKEQWRFGGYSKTNILDLEQTRLEQQESQGLSLQWRKTKQWPKHAFATQMLIAAYSGNAMRKVDDEEAFTKLDGNLQFVKGVGQKGRFKSVFVANFSGQYTDINLPSVESFSLTGPYGVRGFEVGQFSADSAFLGSLEWSLPNFIRPEKSNWYIEPFTFVDWASGIKNALSTTVSTSSGAADDGAPEDSEAFFAGAGGGLRFGFGKHFSGQLYGASPIDGKRDGITVDGDEVWRFELRLQ